MSFKPSFLIRQFQVNVEILAVLPILVKEKYVGIVIADVKMIVDAASLGPGPINETAQKFKKFCTFFWPGVQSSREGATWFHVFLRFPFDHADNVHAIWFFGIAYESAVDLGLVGVPRFGQCKGSAPERHFR